MKLPILLLSCLCSPLAAAPLHKCVDAAGATSYQSTPCPEGERTAWVRDVAPLPPAAAPRPRARPEPRTMPPPARTAARATALPVRRTPTRCETERRAADELRDRQWNRLNFRQRSELDARVARACRRP